VWMGTPVLYEQTVRPCPVGCGSLRTRLALNKPRCATTAAGAVRPTAASSDAFTKV